MIFQITSPIIKSIKHEYLVEDSCIDTLVNCEKLMVINYVSYHDSFDRYITDTGPSSRRKQIYCLYMVLSVFFVLYFAMLTKYYDDTSMKLVGFPLFIPVEARRPFFCFLFLFGVIMLISKLVLFYL